MEEGKKRKLFCKVDNGFLKIIWLIILFTSFFGKILALPQPYDFLSAYRIGLAINGVLFMLSLMMNRHIELNKSLYPYYGFIGLWLVWAAVSILWAGDKTLVIVNLLFVMININIMFFTSYYFVDEEDHINFLKIALFALVINIIFGLLEMMTGIHVPYSKSMEYKGTIAQYIPTAFYINPNDFASYLIMFIPLPYMLFKYGKRYNYLYYSILVAVLYILLYTDSRANYLALFVMILGAIILSIYSKRNNIKLPEKDRLKNMLVVIAIVGIMVLNISGIGQMHKSIHNADEQKINEQLKDLFDIEKQTSIGVRINLIKNGFLILNENPWRYLFGVGAGNTEHYMQCYKDTTRGMINMHNWWMEILVNHGVVFLSLFLAFYMKILLDLLNVYKNATSRLYRMVAAAMLLSMIAFSVASISSSSIFGMSTMWMLFGESLALIGSNKKQMQSIKLECAILRKDELH